MARITEPVADKARTSKRVSREDWLDRVADHILKNGVATFSVRGFASEYGVTTQALMNHFGSRDELIRKALRRATQRDLLHMENMLRRMVSVSEFFANLVSELERAEFRRMFAIQVELFATASLDPEDHSHFAERSTKRVHAIFESQIRREGISEERVDAVSGTLVAFARGLILESLGGKTSEQLQLAVDDILRWYDAQLNERL